MAEFCLWPWLFLLLAQCFVLTKGKDNTPLDGNVTLECSRTAARATDNGYVAVYQLDLKANVLVCKSGFNRGAAAAVCRQLGFVDGKYFDEPTRYGCNPPTTAEEFITHIRCPNVSNYVADGELHIMRCSVGNRTSKCDDNGTVAAVRCSTETLQASVDYSYNGQVRLADGGHQGIVQFRIYDNFYPVCSGSFSANEAADSVCRQLGYTNGSKSHTIKNVEGLNLYSTHCDAENGSFPCFSHCIKNDQYSIKKCDVANITCGFVLDNTVTQSAGSRAQCILNQGTTHHVDAASVFIGLGCGIVLLLIILLMIISYKYKIWRPKRPYREEEPLIEKNRKNNDEGEN